MTLNMKKFFVLLILSALSGSVFAAQDYNSSRSNRGSNADNLEATVTKLVKEVHRDIMGKMRRDQKSSKGKDADSYKDISITLSIKISPSKKSRAQDYNSSRSNNINGQFNQLDSQLRKQLNQQQKQIMKEFRKKQPKTRSMPDSFFDVWVEVSAIKRPAKGKARRQK